MAAHLIGEDEYTDGYQWSEEQEEEGSADQVAQVVAARLESNFPAIDIKGMAKNLRTKK